MPTHRSNGRARARRTFMAALGVALSVGSLDQAALAAHAQPLDDEQPGTEAPIVIDDPAPGRFDSWDDVWDLQEDLNETADRIVVAAAAQETATGALGSVVADPEHGRVELYWKGRLPASVQGVIIHDATVPVVVRQAAYSADELEAEAERIIAEQPAAPAGGTPLVSTVAPLPDASGVQVGVTISAAEALQMPFLRDAEVAHTARGNVTVTADDRADDSPAYWGGARWGTTAGQCSTGFAIVRGTTTSMLTAAHCATNGQTAFDGGSLTTTDKMGPIQNRQLPPSLVVNGSCTGIGCLFTSKTGRDVEEIRTSSGARTFNGGPGSGEFSNPVVGGQNNYPGNFVCTSGSFSGTRCNIKVADTGAFTYMGVTDNIPTYSRDMVHANRVDGQAAAGNGDSGGPVFAVASAHPDKVWARGTHSSSTKIATLTCPGVPAGPGRKCGSEIWYVDLNSALTGTGAQLLTTG